MSETVLKIENLSKLYRLGEVGTGTISHDLNRWFAKVRGKEDPFAKVGQVNDRSQKSTSDYIWALKGVDIEVKKGEVLGIIGKNGAGKSTLLKLISQITAPTAGSIKAKGRVASLLEVGTGMHPEMTAKENIYLNGAILGMTKKEIRSKFDEILDFAGCKMYVDTPIKRFSSGMTVRLAFAVAAFLEPEILIVDEVLAVGDAEFQSKAIGKMKDVSSTGGRTVLFVSHNLASIRALCSRCILLDQGQVYYEGETEQVLKKYFELSNHSLSKEKLIDRVDRVGNQRLKFTNVQLINQEGIEVFDVVSYDPITVRVHFNYDAAVRFENLNIGLSFWDRMENKIAMLVTDEMVIDLQLFEKRKFIDFYIPKLNFRGGKYILKLFASEKVESKIEVLDNIYNAKFIEVIASDLYKIGRPMRSESMLMIEAQIL